jgi:hypothetical protein
VVAVVIAGAVVATSVAADEVCSLTTVVVTVLVTVSLGTVVAVVVALSSGEWMEVEAVGALIVWGVATPPSELGSFVGAVVLLGGGSEAAPEGAVAPSVLVLSELVAACDAGVWELVVDGPVAVSGPLAELAAVLDEVDVPPVSDVVAAAGATGLEVVVVLVGAVVAVAGTALVVAGVVAAGAALFAEPSAESSVDPLDALVAGPAVAEPPVPVADPSLDTGVEEVAVLFVARCGVCPGSFAAPGPVVTDTVGAGGGVADGVGTTGMGAGAGIGGGGGATSVTTGASARALASALAELLPGLCRGGTSE